MSFDLKLHAYRLLMDEPFFAALSRKIEKRACSSIGTAGVRVDPDTAQFEMAYNPEWFASLPEEQVRGVLKHEFYHLIFEHVTSRRPEGVSHKLWNICADLSINSHLIGEIPENGCIPGQAGSPFEDLPVGESAEWYLAKLIEQGKTKKQAGEGESGEGESGEGQPGEGDPSDGLPDNLDDHSGCSGLSSPSDQPE